MPANIRNFSTFNPARGGGANMPHSFSNAYTSGTECRIDLKPGCKFELVRCLKVYEKKLTNLDHLFYQGSPEINNNNNNNNSRFICQVISGTENETEQVNVTVSIASSSNTTIIHCRNQLYALLTV